MSTSPAAYLPSSAQESLPVSWLLRRVAYGLTKGDMIEQTWAYLQLHGRKEMAKEAKCKTKTAHSDGIYATVLLEQSCF
jgi:hypothetical protein